MHEDEMTIVAVEEEDTEPTMRRKALVSHWLELLHTAKGYHESAFRQMKTDMDSAYRGYDPKKWDDDNYVANILQRHVQQRTASLYAKNPKAVCKRRQRMDFQFSFIQWLFPFEYQFSQLFGPQLEDTLCMSC